MRGDEIPPRRVSWEQLTAEHFELGRILPVRPEDAAGGRDLFLELDALLRVELEGGAPSTFGDCVRRIAATAGGPERAAALEVLFTERPDIARRFEPYLSQLLRDDHAHAADWEAGEEEESDGVVLLEPWSLGTVTHGFWGRRKGSELVFQGATLVFADLEAIKGAEADLRTWPERRGEEYDWIGPLEGSYLRGEDSAGLPFASFAYAYRSPLPFPFGNNEAEIRFLHRLDARGRLVTDVISTSDDFYWLAGRDVHFSVLDSKGAWVATLIVRRTGFDLRGVPDGDGERERRVIGGLANLRRAAELRYAELDGEPRTTRGALPDFRVVGPR